MAFFFLLFPLMPGTYLGFWASPVCQAWKDHVGMNSLHGISRSWYCGVITNCQIAICLCFSTDYAASLHKASLLSLHPLRVGGKAVLKNAIAKRIGCKFPLENSINLLRSDLSFKLGTVKWLRYCGWLSAISVVCASCKRQDGVFCG